VPDNETQTPSLEQLYERHSSKWRRFAADVLPMHVAEMDFQIADPIRARIQKMTDESDFGYLGPVPEVAQAFEGFAARHWGWNIDPTQLKLASDVGVATVEFLRANLNPGDRVVVTSPVYSGFYEWLKELRIEPFDVPLAHLDEPFSLDIAGLEEAFKQGHLTVLLCNPHNPTGRVFSRKQLTELAIVAQKYGATVISDEIHAPLSQVPFTPYLSCGPAAEETGVCITSASKAFNLAGLKAAFLLTQGTKMAAKVAKLPAATHWRTSIVGAFAMAEAFTSCDEWLEATVKTLASNAEHLLSQLEVHLPSVKSHIPEAGYLAWLDITELPLSTQDIATKGKVALVPGPDMGGENYKNFARLNFGTSSEIISEGVNRIASALKNAS
jgi:cystathionine beta-lyase